MERHKCGEKMDLLKIQNIQAHLWSTVEELAWACIAASWVGSLIFIDDVTHDDSNRMNSEVYKNILPANFGEMRPNWLGGTCSRTMTQNTLPTQQRTSLGRKSGRF